MQHTRTLRQAEAWQLSGYLLLDTDDRYRVDTVALYLSRSGTLATWPVEEYLELLGACRRDALAFRTASALAFICTGAVCRHRSVTGSRRTEPCRSPALSALTYHDHAYRGATTDDRDPRTRRLRGTDSMRHSNGIRRAALATTAVTAVAAAVAGIVPGTAMAASTTTSAPPPACPASALQVSAWQAVHRPVGTGTGAAVVQFTNVSRKTCVLKGHPTVAGAANGSPAHNTPLKVTPIGRAATVTVRPHGKAWVKLTFVQVQGEADGYCVSGKAPVTYPTMVIGLPHSGKHQVALNDGVWAECDNKVTVTPVSAVKPS
ncbi:hypothetical protein GCM10010510_67250 [Streptomyces anandii JCM 4720]|nr:hypothetical protein GCM10010510_67250 [Streptomyces anandii JCM 4720]